MAHKCVGCGLYIDGPDGKKCDSPNCPGGITITESVYSDEEFASTFGPFPNEPPPIAKPKIQEDPWQFMRRKS